MGAIGRSALLMEILLFFATRRFMMERTGVQSDRSWSIGYGRTPGANWQYEEMHFHEQTKSRIGNEVNTLNPFETFSIAMNQPL
jgi:hypothetical protein